MVRERTLPNQGCAPHGISALTRRGVAAQSALSVSDLWLKVTLSFGGDMEVTGDSERFRSRSIGDRPC
jgi:hypothetical protein